MIIYCLIKDERSTFKSDAKKTHYLSTISAQMVTKICPLADKVFENEIRKKAHTDALVR
jgi:hypothetical protein